MDVANQKEKSTGDALLMRMLVVKEKEAISHEKIKCWICLFEVYNYIRFLKKHSHYGTFPGKIVHFVPFKQLFW